MSILNTFSYYATIALLTIVGSLLLGACNNKNSNSNNQNNTDTVSFASVTPIWFSSSGCFGSPQIHGAHLAFDGNPKTSFMLDHPMGTGTFIFFRFAAPVYISKAIVRFRHIKTSPTIGILVADSLVQNVKQSGNMLNSRFSVFYIHFFDSLVNTKFDVGDSLHFYPEISEIEFYDSLGKQFLVGPLLLKEVSVAASMVRQPVSINAAACAFDGNPLTICRTDTSFGYEPSFFFSFERTDVGFSPLITSFVGWLGHPNGCSTMELKIKDVVFTMLFRGSGISAFKPAKHIPTHKFIFELNLEGELDGFGDVMINTDKGLILFDDRVQGFNIQSSTAFYHNTNIGAYLGKAFFINQNGDIQYFQLKPDYTFEYAEMKENNNSIELTKYIFGQWERRWSVKGTLEYVAFEKSGNKGLLGILNERKFDKKEGLVTITDNNINFNNLFAIKTN